MTYTSILVLSKYIHYDQELKSAVKLLHLITLIKQWDSDQSSFS